jgi:hypothetical protein
LRRSRVRVSGFLAKELSDSRRKWGMVDFRGV